MKMFFFLMEIVKKKRNCLAIAIRLKKETFLHRIFCRKIFGKEPNRKSGAIYFESTKYLYNPPHYIDIKINKSIIVIGSD